jgi:hypothetical protein
MPDGTSVSVYLLARKSSIKRYCEDTELDFKDGLKRLYYDWKPN